MSEKLKKSINTILSVSKKIWEARAFLLRALVCWIVGIGVLSTERSDNFDMRFKMRGNILRQNDITIILISEDEWTMLKGSDRQTLRPLKEIEGINDSYFNDKKIWEAIINRINGLDPKAIGITFFIDDIFQHPRVVWTARLESEGVLIRPRSNIEDRYLGLIDIKTDADGYLRRYTSSKRPLPSLPMRLTERVRENLSFPKAENIMINYQGGSGSFLTFTLTEVLYGSLPEEAFKDKIILIGSKDIAAHKILTPIGQMQKAEVMANITQNLIHRQWIKTMPMTIYAILLLGLLILSIWITVTYSQSAVLMFLGAIWTLHFTISTWVFDSYYIWMPIVAPTVQLVITFVVFLSYQLIVNEKENWRLQQEKRYLEEIEEIKNNFLSLISHDLKTPIAKIQAVADRLLLIPQEEKVSTDLKTVKNASQDLHRYIQTLLQVARVESTDFHARKAPADINEIITKVIEDLMPLAREKNITIEHNLEPMFSIVLDSTLIYEVLLNLAENALKYSPEGNTIKITSLEVGNFVEVHVIDSGEGIPADEIPKVWNKFYRGRRHDITTKGTGLGLYLAKYFIDLHGGSVFIKSEFGKGTDVGFKLPLEETEETTSTEV